MLATETMETYDAAKAPSTSEQCEKMSPTMVFASASTPIPAETLAHRHVHSK
jgi:hypothetical protein